MASISVAELAKELSHLTIDNHRSETEASSTAASFAARLAALEAVQTHSAATLPPALAPATPPGLLQLRRLSSDANGAAIELTSIEDAVTCLAANLEHIGLRKSAARPLAEDICAAAFAGQIVFLKGSFAAASARCAALSLSGSASVRVSMPLGLSNGDAFHAAREMIKSNITSAAALVIEGVNRTALDIYADAVSDLMADEPGGDGGKFDFVFATVMQGVAALALEPRHLELGPVFDLDHLEWRVKRQVSPLKPGALSRGVLQDFRTRLETRSVETEELLRLSRRFLLKKNPRIEGAVVAASASLNVIGRRGAPTILQSLAFGWIVPLWLALEVSKEDADGELDNGKCDSATADPRLASIFASSDFGEGRPA